MRRYASNMLFLPGQGYLKQYVVETEDGYAVNTYPLTEEIEDAEWLPGAIILQPVDSKLLPVYYSSFDFTAMQPVAGTPNRLLR